MDCFKSLFGVRPPAAVLPIKPDPVMPPPKPSNLHQKLADQYYQAEVRAERLAEVTSICQRVILSRPRYQAISNTTGVPWFLIAGIHFKEASLDFRAYLGNGQLIIGTGRKSTIVPIGRGPFDTFEAGAAEALGDQRGKPWDLGSCLYWAEGFNGYGYEAHGINSPYLFAATTLYTTGGYPRDHYYDPSYVIRNPGIVAIMRGLNLFPKTAA